MKSVFVFGSVFCAALVLHAAPVVSVSARDNAGADASDALAQCTVKPGDAYDADRCREDARAIRDVGTFDEVSVEAEHSGNGIAVTYVVRRKSVFQGPLQAKGNEFWGVSKIANLAGLEDGRAYGEAEFAAAAARIRTAYNKKRFADARVTPVVAPVPDSLGAVTVTMEIEEGSRVEAGGYDFAGNDSIDAEELRRVIGVYPWWNPIGWFASDPTSEQEFAEACAKLAAYYRDLGFLDASVDMPESALDAKGRTHWLFPVDEGPRYTVGSLRVTGLTQYPESAALEAASARVAVGAIAGESALNDAARAIEIYCGSGAKALADTRVDVRREVAADGSLAVTFAVTEGRPVRIRNVMVRGNDYTQDKVIRREITLSPGDPMLSDKAEQSKRKLENLRYFERVQYYLERPADGGAAADGGAEWRDIVYDVKEKNTGNFMIGVGASSVDSVYGTLELSESNFDLFNPWRFRGAGQKGRLLVQAGPRVQTYEASVSEPWFLDRPLELTVTAYRRQRWYDDYDIVRSGASASISYPVKFWPTWSTKGRFGASIAAELVQFDDVENDYGWADSGPFKNKYGPYFKWEQDEYDDALEVPIELFWIDDTRDHFIRPTKGHKLKLYGDLVGGDNSYWRIGGDFRQYWNVWKAHEHVLMFAARFATEDAFSDDIPIYDRFFLGGPRSIRGVDYREVGPWMWKNAVVGRKSGDHSPIGGQTTWCMNLEYTLPLVKMIRFAAFTDIGSVAPDAFDFDNEYLCWSVGVGLRVDIDQFPIRLDFAVPVDCADDTDEEVFSFSVGYDF